MGKLFSMVVDWTFSFVSGLTMKQWAAIVGVIAAGIIFWAAYSWAYGRGEASQKAADAELHEQDQAKIKILSDSVLSLVDAVKAANDRIALEAAKAREADAKAAATAQKGRADEEASRRLEATRGAGAKNMNDFIGGYYP